MIPESVQAALQAARNQLPAVVLIEGDAPGLEAELSLEPQAGLNFVTTCATRLLQPFAGLTELVEQLYNAAQAVECPELALRQWIAIRLIAPGLADRVPARRPDACQIYRPGDTVRRAAPIWIERCYHGLIDLIFALQDRTGAPLSIGLRDLHMANRQVKLFLTLLLRRAAGRSILVWTTTAGETPPDLLRDLQAVGAVTYHAIGTPIQVAPSEPETATVEELAAAMDYYCYHGLFDEIVEWGQLAFSQAGPAHHHLLPVLIETYRVAQNGQNHPKVAEQLLLQSLPYAKTVKDRVMALNYLAIMYGQWTVDPVRGSYYADLAMQAANSVSDPAYRAELRVIATHGRILVDSNAGRIPEAQEAGQAAICGLEEHCAWEVERVRRSMVLYLMGQNYERLGQGETAVEYYKQSLAYDVDYPEYYHYLCAALNRVGRYAECLAVLEDAMERTPPYWRFHMWRGQALAGLGRFLEASAEFDRAVDLHPEHRQVWLSRALFRHEQGDLRAAVADYTAYLQLRPGDVEALANRGSARHDLGDLQEALSDLDMALERQPDLLGALVNRAALLVDLGRAADALADLERALLVDPANEIVQANRTALMAVVK